MADKLSNLPISKPRLARAAVVITLPILYLSYTFRLSQPDFWAAGLGDWWDPYFINFLMEHWYQSGFRLTDPTTPSMSLPVEGTLGPSNGLVLYVPFSAIARLFLHPFQPYNTALCAVKAAGPFCLYALLR